MQRGILEKVNIMEEQVGDVSRDMQTPRKDQKAMLDIKQQNCKRNKKVYDGFINKLNMAEGTPPVNFKKCQ